MRARQQSSDQSKPPISFWPAMPGEITAENVDEKIRLCFLAKGREGEEFMIRNARVAYADLAKETPERWVAWLAFFAKIMPEKRVRKIESMGFRMVPCEWPWEFSLDADDDEERLQCLLDDYNRRFHPASKVSPERVRALISHMRAQRSAGTAPKPKQPNIVERQAEDPVDYGAGLRLSDTLRTKLGVPAPEPPRAPDADDDDLRGMI